MLRREKDLTTVTWLQEERGAGRFDADCAAQKTSPRDEDALYAGWAAYEGDAPVTVPDAPPEGRRLSLPKPGVPRSRMWSGKPLPAPVKPDTVRSASGRRSLLFR